MAGDRIGLHWPDLDRVGSHAVTADRASGAGIPPVVPAAATPTPAAPGPGGYFPPEGYAPIWTVLTVVLILALAGWGLFVWLRTRPAKLAPVIVPPPWWRVQYLKWAYTRRIDELVARSYAGQVGGREASQELSSLVRGFALQASGYPAPTMTYSDLVSSGVPVLYGVASVVERLYPGEFGPRPDLPVLDQAVHARGVVTSWG